MGKKTFIIVAALILIASAAWYYFNPGKNILEVLGLKKKPAPLPTDPEEIKNLSADNGSFVTGSKIVQDERGFPLMQGSRNEYVKNVQKALNSRFAAGLVEDGIYGPKTRRALSVNHFPETIYYKHYYEILGIQS